MDTTPLLFVLPSTTDLQGIELPEQSLCSRCQRIGLLGVRQGPDGETQVVSELEADNFVRLYEQRH